MEYSRCKVVDDSGVHIRLVDEVSFSLTTAILLDVHDSIVRIWPLSCPKSLRIDFYTNSIDLPKRREGTLADDGKYYYIPVNDVIEKCVHWRILDTSKTMFFRFPNLEECS